MSDSLLRILVVDDEQSQILMIKKSLPCVAKELNIPFDFDIDFANCVDSAIAAIDLRESSGRGYDFIVSDIQMPRKNGFDFFDELKSRGSFSGVIAMSGSGSEEYMRRAIEYGCISFLQKPFRVFDLADVIWHGVWEHVFV